MYKTDISQEVECKTPSGKSIYWLIKSEIGAPNFELRYVEIPSDCQGELASHPHEHEVFVIKGEGRVEGEEYSEKIKPGDAIFIPGNEKHKWVNTGENVLGFICVVPSGAESELKRKQ